MSHILRVICHKSYTYPINFGHQSLNQTKQKRITFQKATQIKILERIKYCFIHLTFFWNSFTINGLNYLFYDEIIACFLIV